MPRSKGLTQNPRAKCTFSTASTACASLAAQKDLQAHVRLPEGWKFPGVDVAQLTQDAIDQHNERLQHDTAESQFDKLHETFGLAQESRYDRFSAALNAARGAFRSNKAVLAQLDHFTRSAHRAAKPAVADKKPAA